MGKEDSAGPLSWVSSSSPFHLSSGPYGGEVCLWKALHFRAWGFSEPERMLVSLTQFRIP